MFEQGNNEGFSFIQEKVTSKKKSRLRRMFFSVIWTTLLACVFGMVAGVVFVVSGPAIHKIFGKEEEKKTVEFPTTIPEDDKTVNGNSGEKEPFPKGTSPSGEAPEPSDNDDKKGEGKTDSEDDPVVIEKSIDATLKDVMSISSELKGIYNQVNKSLVTVNSITSEMDWFNNEIELAKTTTGLVFWGNGSEFLILTSYGKIKDGKEIQIILGDPTSTKVSGNLQSYDEELNLAVVSIATEALNKNQLDYIEIAKLGESYMATPGTPVLAMGAPNGYVGSLEFGMVTGRISSIYVTDFKVDVFHTDITYNKNSEGIMVNLNGEVIGIITQSLRDEENEGINTVLGISKIKKIIERLGSNEEQIYFGIKGEDMTEAALKEFGISSGLYVTEVQANSPALAGGLQSGDIILRINDTNITSVQSLHNTINMHSSKSAVKVVVRRTTSKAGTKEMELVVVLGKKNG